MGGVPEKTFLRRYWPYLLGFGAGSNIYLRTHQDPSVMSVLLGGVGLVAIFMGLAGLRLSRPARETSPDDSVDKDSSVWHVTPSGVATKPTAKARSASRFRNWINPSRVVWIVGTVLFVFAALVEMLFVPTNCGWRWARELGLLDVSPDGYTVIQLVSRDCVRHEINTVVLFAAVAGAALILVRYHSQLRREVVRNWRLAPLAFCGLIVVLLFLYVPCTHSYVRLYGSRTITVSDGYRWLWQVGELDIKYGVVLLEQLAVR